MTKIKDILETEYVSHYSIMSKPIADSQVHTELQFDLEDIQASVTFKLLPKGQGTLLLIIRFLESLR